MAVNPRTITCTKNDSRRAYLGLTAICAEPEVLEELPVHKTVRMRSNLKEKNGENVKVAVEPVNWSLVLNGLAVTIKCGR